MRNKPKSDEKRNVEEEKLGETLRLKDNPSRDDLRKANSPVSRILRRFSS